ncbi:LytTR family DNA-binding domain-containing protein [Fulvivirgaceae bacterium BMA12]|uniref:LytTR family DNA-binding domain-containing protein n=1 Tax=Agaribacillus aureus TaxID=3051825 RepID=A0ABT8LDU4_9BACT|nr:LytTR family DNA-binding domain-containing protein [Fulvivirgaceae bacterium BMA12]
MIINCIAIDDEPLALDILSAYVAKISFLKLQATFDNALQTLEYLKSNEVDLIFLDIEMDDLTGIQFLKVLKNRPHIIFTTAYENYALQGFELDAIDYLLKPISFERFVVAARKVYEKMAIREAGKPANDTDIIQNTREGYIFIKTGFQLQKVNLADIQYIEGQGDYLKIVTVNEKIMTLQNFKNLKKALPLDEFVRVHKSYLVSLAHIQCIEKNRIKIGDAIIPISETYGKHFFHLLQDKNLLP